MVDGVGAASEKCLQPLSINPLQSAVSRASLLQMDALSPEPYKNMTDCFQSVVRKEGWRGLYKGFGMSLLKIVPAAGICWCFSTLALPGLRK